MHAMPHRRRRSLPHTLRSLKIADQDVAELTMLCGFDDDLASQITQTSNRIVACSRRSIRHWSAPSVHIWIIPRCSTCAPVTRRSGSSIRGEQPSRRGNKQLKRALFLSAFAALRDPISRAYYARKISQGKRHNQALIALARRRCDVLFAMLRDGTFYCPPTTETPLTTT